MRSMKSNLVMSLLVGLSLIVNSGCIHTSAIEDRNLSLKESDKTAEQMSERTSLRIESVIYSEGKWPLSDFFSRLMAGEFKEAIAKVDIRYVPSNTKNEILRELINDGFVPVFVRVKNTSAVPVQVSEAQFHIEDGKIRVRAIESTQIPRVFKRFSSEAFIANTINVGAVVLAFTVLFYAMAESDNYGNGFRLFDFSSSSSGGGGDIKILNETEKTTRINYRNYLLKATTIPPHSETQGLLFFYNSSKADSKTFRLTFEEAK
jgi:hypothetical protein